MGVMVSLIVSVRGSRVRGTLMKTLMRPDSSDAGDDTVGETGQNTLDRRIWIFDSLSVLLLD